jgi:hypothetical protein
MNYKYYLPNELWDKIMIMSYYLMAREKKQKFNQIHRQLKKLFDYTYDYYIDKYIGYESFIICMDDNGLYVFDEERIKDTSTNILYSIMRRNNLVECIIAMQQTRLEYT